MGSGTETDREEVKSEAEPAVKLKLLVLNHISGLQFDFRVYNRAKTVLLNRKYDLTGDRLYDYQLHI
jgi:hypothetical protein